MTLAEYDQKIEELEAVQSKSSGLKKAEITNVLDNLRTARVESLAGKLSNADFGFSSEDVQELEAIASSFQGATDEIDNANELIDNAIRLGKKLLALVM